MADHRRLPSPALHRGVWYGGAAVLAWLAFQNAMLLLWFSSAHLEPVFVVIRAMARVGVHLAAEFWMFPAAVFLGVALALTGVAPEDVRGREVRRV